MDSYDNQRILRLARRNCLHLCSLTPPDAPSTASNLPMEQTLAYQLHRLDTAKIDIEIENVLVQKPIFTTDSLHKFLTTARPAGSPVASRSATGPFSVWSSAWVRHACCPEGLPRTQLLDMTWSTSIYVYNVLIDNRFMNYHVNSIRCISQQVEFTRCNIPTPWKRPNWANSK